MLRALTYVLRKSVLVLAVAVIALAVLVQLGRSFSYLLADYRPQLETFLSEQTGTDVQLDHIAADWSGLQPALEVQGIVVTASTGERLLAMDSARFRLDIMASVLAWSPVWGDVELAGGAMALRQNERGHWRLQGASNNEVRPSSKLHDMLLDILLASRHIAFNRTHLDFHFDNGEQVRLDSPSLLLENSGNFHRLTLRLGVGGQREALSFLLELHGDPRDKRFIADGYLQLRDFPLNKLTDALLKRAGLERPAVRAKGAVSASLWFGRKAGNSSVSVLGDVSLADVSIPLPDAVTPSTQMRGQVSGQIASVDLWHIALQQTQWALAQQAPLELDLIASRDGQGAPLQLRSSGIDLAQLTGLLQSSELLTPYPALTHLVDSLNATGSVSALTLSTEPGHWGDWQLAANVENISVGNWNQVPAFSNVSAYVQANAHGGTVQLDSRDGFSMDFPSIYQRPLEFDLAQGQVAWYLRPADNRIYVNSGSLAVNDGDERAQGYFHLALPWQPGTRPVDLTIYVKAQQVAAGQYRKYLPMLVPDQLSQYLERGIGSDNPGIASQAAFIYRGAIDSSEAADHTVALELEVTDGDFDYHPDWPAARDLAGHLLLDDSDLYTTLAQGKIYNSDIKNASIKLADNPHDSGKILTLTGRVDGIASDGLRILRQSVLRDYVGDSMDTWYLHGELDALVDLSIPLDSGAAGSYHDLEFTVDASTFALDNYGLELANFSGRVFYNSDDGLRSENLRGQLFGHNADIVLSTEQAQQHSKTIIDVEAQASAHQLAGWSEQPGLLFAQGEIPLKVHIELNHRDANMTANAASEAIVGDEDNTQNEPDDDLIAAVAITADLLHTHVNLPAPLGKSSGAPGQLVINYILGKQTALADVHYLDRLRGLLHIEPASQQLLGAAVALGGEPELLPNPALHVTGRLEQLDVAPWQQVLQRYQHYATQLLGRSEAAELAGLPLPLSARVRIAEQPIGDFKLHDVQLQLQQRPEAWNVKVASEALTGELNWPLDEAAPLVLNISHLRLPKPADKKPETDTASALTALELPEPEPLLTPQILQQLRPAQVSIERFQLADEEYGRWQFNLVPEPDSLLLTDLHGQLRGLTIKNAEPENAALRWQIAPERTELKAHLSAANMADVMHQWQAPQSLESESADYQLRLSWLGGPAEFELAKLEGEVSVEIGSGRFVRDSATSAEGLLRLMGLFNFDSLARRLRLDFSDLYKSGLTFDKITGAVRFDSGQLAVTEPVLLRTPSSRMQLTGNVNLIDQTLKMNLVATLPMGGNLTVIAALAGGLPAAAGVFVISKLFEEQMNKATSLTYSITGDWDDPVMAFDRAAEAERPNK